MTEEKRLLKIAEEKLIQLHQENEELSTSFYELMDAQKAEAEQMVQLTEQMWVLEEALAVSQEQAMKQMDLMKTKMKSVSDYVKDTLEAASNNASRMELAARIYEMGQISDTEEIDKKIAEFNKELMSKKPL